MTRTITNPCRAMTRRGTPCQLPAIAGGVVCRSHGGTLPSVRRKAQERLTLRAALDHMPRREVGHVLLDAVHFADVLQRLAVLNVKEGDVVTEEFVEAITTAQRMASAAHTARAEEALAKRAQVEGAYIAHVLNRAIAMARDPNALVDQPIPDGWWSDAVEFRLRAGLRIALLEDDEPPKEIEGSVVNPARVKRT